MVKIKNVLTVVLVLITMNGWAQLPDGSIAPDFTLKDIVDSNTYNLYSYLDQGKTCFIEIFAAHCPGCWSYHQGGALKNLYNTYGPNGTDEVMVFALEFDEYNFYDAFIGIGPAWVTAGNWLSGTPYPVFQVEGADRVVFSDYNVTAYPLVFMVCPNRVLKRVSTALDASNLYNGVVDCDWLQFDEQKSLGDFYVVDRKLVLDNLQDPVSVKVMTMQGQIMMDLNRVENTPVSLLDLDAGVYLFQVTTALGTNTKRFEVK